MDSLDNDFNETETRDFFTDAFKAKGWNLKFNMRYEFKITDGRVQIDEDDDIVVKFFSCIKQWKILCIYKSLKWS